MAKNAFVLFRIEKLTVIITSNSDTLNLVKNAKRNGNKKCEINASVKV